MRVIIVGCGRLGGVIATNLSSLGHDVVIVDIDSNSFRRLGPEFTGRRIVGNGIDEDVLKKAEVVHADVVFASTQRDNTNIMVVQMCREKFHVKKAIARIAEPLRAKAYEELGIPVISQTAFIAEVVKEAILGEE